MVRELPPGYLPRPHWPVDRFPPDPIESYRYHHHEQQDFRGPPMGIDRALREQCKIPAKYYFVAAVLDDGTEVTFSSPNRSQEGLVPKFFNMQRWVQWTTHGSNATSPLVEEPDLGTEEYSRPAHSEYSNRRAYDRRRVHPSDAFDAQRNRKRPRAVGFHRDLDLVDDDPAPIVKAKKVSIKIGDSKQVWDLYDQRFRNLQQTACKIMAKAWVKLVEPKKQSTHPYTGSDEKAPDWWPKPWGPTRDEKVRHKEPDHLYKKGTS